MSVSNPIKKVNKIKMGCDEQAELTISFDSSAELITRPADIIILFDRSGSMNGQRLTNAKKGVNELIDMVTLASGGTLGDTILNSSRIGIISFSTDTAIETDLTDNVATLKNKVDSINASGNTNHEQAFKAASLMIDKASTNDKIVIMFTDGITTAGGNPEPEAEKLKAAGAEIFCIGLVNNSENLKKWASDPKDTHVAATDDVLKLEELFKKIAYEVILAGAKDVEIREELNKDFKIVDIDSNHRGTVTVLNPQTIIWNIDAVGLTVKDTETLKLNIEYIGNKGGIKKVNKDITYSDRDNNTLVFDNPEIEVLCDGEIIKPEPCPVPTDITVEGCKDYTSVTVSETKLESIGRIVSVDVPIKNVCPDKKIAVAVILTEIDLQGVEHQRGMKTFLVPSHNGPGCQDILIKCINFVVPEALDEAGNKEAMCNERFFKARAIANYIDTDYICCDAKATIIKD